MTPHLRALAQDKRVDVWNRLRGLWFLASVLQWAPGYGTPRPFATVRQAFVDLEVDDVDRDPAGPPEHERFVHGAAAHQLDLGGRHAEVVVAGMETHAPLAPGAREASTLGWTS
ncbi:MAG: hypothetical protein CMJ83_17480 [Planctomycetes bacterium]|nr:hypothetical protein [Planctomycetota bacterium]